MSCLLKACIMNTVKMTDRRQREIVSEHLSPLARIKAVGKALQGGLIF